MADYIIEKLPNSLFKLTMHVPEIFYEDLVGYDEETKKRIERETYTHITIPLNDINSDLPKNENVLVIGRTSDSISLARGRIISLLQLIRSRMKRTHFVGVLLNSEEIRNNFLEFKKNILHTLPGIDERIFQSEDRLHITFFVTVLIDKVEHAYAIKLLECCREYLKSVRTPFKVDVAGLEVMNKNPRFTRKLYARVNAPEFEKFRNQCLNAFNPSGFPSERYSRRIGRLHMTVLNMKFLKRKDSNAPQSFDAREILEKFGNFYFGTVQINSISLLKVGGYIQDGLDIDTYKNNYTLEFKLESNVNL